MDGYINEIKRQHLRESLYRNREKNRKILYRLRRDKDHLYYEYTEVVMLIERITRLNPVKVIPGMCKGTYQMLHDIGEVYKENGTKGATVLEIVAFTELPAPMVSRKLKDMEKEGLIRRHTNPKDRRETIVTITAKGKELHDKSRGIIQDLYLDAFKQIGFDDLSQMNKTLTRCVENIERQIGKRLTGDKAEEIVEFMNTPLDSKYADLIDQKKLDRKDPNNAGRSVQKKTAGTDPVKKRTAGKEVSR